MVDVSMSTTQMDDLLTHSMAGEPSTQSMNEMQSTADEVMEVTQATKRIDGVYLGMNNSVIAVFDLPTDTFSAIFALLGVCILSGNLLVVLAILRYRRLRTVPNVFLFNMAVSDIFTGTLAAPLLLVLIRYITSVSNLVCLLAQGVLFIPPITSVLSLFAISVNRYLAITKPFLYDRYMTFRVAGTVVVVVWCLSAVLTLAPLHSALVRDAICVFEPMFTKEYIIILSTGILFTMLLTTFFYVLIFAVARQQARKIATQIAVVCPGQAQTFRRDTDVKLTKMTATLLGAFYICWVPRLSMFLAATLDPTIMFDEQLATLDMCFSTLVLVNSVLNPFIYGLLNQDFKMAYKRMFGIRNTGEEASTMITAWA